MIDHVSIGVRDLTTAKDFYRAVLSEIGYAVIDDREETIVLERNILISG